MAISEGIFVLGASMVAQMVKNLPAMQETRVLWRRNWQPTPVFLPGESHGQRSPADHGVWVDAAGT